MSKSSLVSSVDDLQHYSYNINLSEGMMLQTWHG